MFYKWLRCVYVLGFSLVYADWAYNMPRGVTANSHKIYDLHMMVFYICLVIAIGVFAALFYAIFAFRIYAHP